MNRVATAILVVSSFLGGGSTVYSAFQIQLPSRTSLKVTPDAANIWSWHKEILLPSAVGSRTTHRERVLVDFNGNGRMDTEDPEVRVTITDLQFVVPYRIRTGISFQGLVSVWISDGTRRRWCLFDKEETQGTDPLVPFMQGNYQQHLQTPIVLEPGSDLFVEFDLVGSPAMLVVVNLLGREIVL